MPSSSLFLRSSATLVSIASLFSSAAAIPTLHERQSPNPQYELTKTYQGRSFFDDWTFFDQADPTHGFVTYGNRKYAEDNGLISFDGDYAVMSIESRTNLGKGANYYANNGAGDYWLRNGVGRKSVRIEGNKEFTKGLIIADIGQMPSGQCGAWPAFWTLGSGQWPSNGEIDIIEGAHTQGGFWSALHSEGVSNINGNTDRMTGRIAATDCQVRLNDPNPNFTGCKIEDSDAATWDAYTGGVWASQWTSERIKIWYWPYGRVPSDVTSGNPVPGSSSWGTPRASYAPPQNLNADANYKNHHLIFDTTFCGDLGDAVWASSGCAARTGYRACADYVANVPSAFANAKWKVKYVKIFEESKPRSSSSSSSVASSTSSVRSSSSSVVSSTRSSSSVASSSAAPSSSASRSVASSSSVSRSVASSSSVSRSVAPSSSVSRSIASPSSVSSHAVVTSSAVPSFSTISHWGNYSLSHGAGPRTSSRGHHGGGGNGDGGDDDYEPKPTSSKIYDGGYDGGYEGHPSKPSTSSKPYYGGDKGGYGDAPKPTSSKPYGGKGGYGDDEEEECVTSTITTVTRTPCATPPYWQDVTTTYVKTVTVKVYPTPHVEHDGLGYNGAKPSKDAVVLPPPAQYSPVKPGGGKDYDTPASPVGGGKGYDTPASPVGGSKGNDTPAAPGGGSKGYDTHASPVRGGKGYDTPAAPAVPSKSYGAGGDSWPLAGPTPTNKGYGYQPTTTYGAKPSQFTGGASSNAAIGGGFLAAALGVAAGMLM